MLYGENRLVAEFKTTNNLNDSYPIDNPSNAIIRVAENDPTLVENQITLDYDESLDRYVYDGAQGFLKYGREYLLEAFIEDSELQAIKSRTIVPQRDSIYEVELLDEKTYEDIDGNIFWEGTVGMYFSESNSKTERFSHLVLGEYKTLKEVVDNEIVYTKEGEEHYFKLQNVNVGAGSIVDMVHRDGYLLELDELEDNYLELVLRSTIPITEPNQVNEVLHSKLFAVSDEHYEYHKSLHNILKNKDNIFEEKALYSSNIENGLGIFSSCVRDTKELILK